MPNGLRQRVICYHGNGGHIILEHLLASQGDICSLANAFCSFWFRANSGGKNADLVSKNRQIESWDLFT